MAIKTTLATIQMRRGAEEFFDPDQMTEGEWAVSTDSKKVWMCFRPGLVLRMATYEAFEEDMKIVRQILKECQDIQVAVEEFVKLAEQHENHAEMYSKDSKSWAVGGTGIREGEDTDNSKYYSEQSKKYLDETKQVASDTVDEIINAIGGEPIEFHIDIETGYLYYTGSTFIFSLSVDGNLLWGVL